jgi:CRISPR-associated protein Cas2
MTVLVISKVPRSLRGKLTRWLLQLKAGIYVGALSHRVQGRLWKSTCESLRGGWAVMLCSAQTEQGFEIRSHGAGPFEFEDIEGLWLAKKRKLR